MAELEAIPAATVIVMRDVPGGAPEILMVERARAMTFAGGALVFPGGRVDPGDRALAALLMPDDPEEGAARIAAVRETLEEAGVAVGLTVEPAHIPLLRSRLYAGEPMGALLAGAGAEWALDTLVPFARWLPSMVPHKIFDTRFYLARVPVGAEPVVDGNENVRVFWTTARAVLDAADSGAATVIFPTRRNLDRLAGFASFAEAAADAATYPVRTITPWIEARGGVPHLCIPEGLGYPITAEPLDRVQRA
ncbi:NUDIX hydrolase [Sphingomonas sp. CJ20]